MYIKSITSTSNTITLYSPSQLHSFLFRYQILFVVHSRPRSEISPYKQAYLPIPSSPPCVEIYQVEPVSKSTKLLKSIYNFFKTTQNVHQVHHHCRGCCCPCLCQPSPSRRVWLLQRHSSRHVLQQHRSPGLQDQHQPRRLLARFR